MNPNTPTMPEKPIKGIPATETPIGKLLVELIESSPNRNSLMGDDSIEKFVELRYEAYYNEFNRLNSEGVNFSMASEAAREIFFKDFNEE